MRSGEAHASRVSGALVLLALAGVLGVGGCVQAQNTEPLSPSEVELGQRFLHLTGQFGFSELVRSSRTASGLLFEYLPEGETLDDWHFRASVVLVRLADDWDEGATRLPAYVQAFRKQLVSENEVMTFEGSGDVTFVDYQLGEGSRREHVLAAIWQAMPGVAAAFQVQRRPERFDAAQLEQFKDAAGRISRAPREGPAEPPAAP